MDVAYTFRFDAGFASASNYANTRSLNSNQRSKEVILISNIEVVMTSKQTPCNKGNIVFFEKDDPRAGNALREALSHINVPILGLVLKVKESENGDEIVNWMYADEELLKSLSLILPRK